MVCGRSNRVVREIVFLGRSNVGKSTLLRQMVGKKVRVGRKPGVTLKPNQFFLDDLLITDLPGFGFMHGVQKQKNEQIKSSIIRYLEENSDRILLAVQVIDAGSFVDLVDRWSMRNEIPIDVEFFHFLHDLDLDVVIAVNKIDKLGDIESELDEIVQRLGMYPPWRQWRDKIALICAKKGEVGELRELIKSRLHDIKRDDLLKHFS
ncbi:MAG TPA: GTP-binding protein EngB [Methanocellales archaeon]|nr:GTP-binding protein EngB [Methanocellales archaeon]